MATRPVRPQPLLAVSNVLASSHWYAELLDLQMLDDSTEATHGNVYNRLYANEGLVLQLHSWDDEEHPNLIGEHDARHGHGVLVWFEVDDFDTVVAQAHGLNAEIVLQPHINDGPKHRELWLCDPDGYVVVVASPDGEATHSSEVD